jgi:hypothetical protein
MYKLYRNTYMQLPSPTFSKHCLNNERSLSMCNGGGGGGGGEFGGGGGGGHEAKSFFLAGTWAQFYKKQTGLKQKYIYRANKALKKQVCIVNIVVPGHSPK